MNSIPKNSRNETSCHVTDEKPNNVLPIEFSNENSNTQTTRISCQKFDYDNKACLHSDKPKLSGHRTMSCEPIILRFNLIDTRNNFWFFSNSGTKTLNDTQVNDLNFDDNYCS